MKEYIIRTVCDWREEYNMIVAEEKQTTTLEAFVQEMVCQFQSV